MNIQGATASMLLARNARLRQRPRPKLLKAVVRMALPPAFLDELRARTPMAPLVSKTVELVKAGKHWKGRCPFKVETNPAFYVYDDGYHCFGCGAHGDAIGFVMETEKLNFLDAVAILAKQLNLTVPEQEATSLPAKVVVKAIPPPEPTWTIENKSAFSTSQIEAVLGTAAHLLVGNGQLPSASILANATCKIEHWEHDNWNGGQDTWRLLLAVPAGVYFGLQDREARETEIYNALIMPMEALSSSDAMFVKIVTSLVEDPDWRRKVNQHISGEGITNQGRVNSANIATREYEGLLFRSRPEVYFYQALKRSSVPFAPLSVVLHGGLTYRRVEPDFIIYRDGLVMLVEIDGDNYHSETPAAAHARLKFLTDEGVKLERINATACDTAQKAVEAVDRVLGLMDKLRRAK